MLLPNQGSSFWNHVVMMVHPIRGQFALKTCVRARRLIFSTRSGAPERRVSRT